MTESLSLFPAPIKELSVIGSLTFETLADVTVATFGFISFVGASKPPCQPSLALICVLRTLALALALVALGRQGRHHAVKNRSHCVLHCVQSSLPGPPPSILMVGCFLRGSPTTTTTTAPHLPTCIPLVNEARGTVLGWTSRWRSGGVGSRVLAHAPPCQIFETSSFLCLNLFISPLHAPTHEAVTLKARDKGLLLGAVPSRWVHQTPVLLFCFVVGVQWSTFIVECPGTCTCQNRSGRRCVAPLQREIAPRASKLGAVADVESVCVHPHPATATERMYRMGLSVSERAQLALRLERERGGRVWDCGWG